MSVVQENMNYYCALCGYENFKEKEIDSKMKKYVGELADIDIKSGFAIKSNFNVINFKKDSKEFMESLFRLHPIDYISDEVADISLNGFTGASTKEFADYFNFLSITIDPYDLPIQFDRKQLFGKILIHTFSLETNNDFIYLDVLNRIKVCFSKYKFGTYPNYNRSTTLTHEVVHSQLMSHKGIVKDYYNEETMSIFLELLHAYKTNNLLFFKRLMYRANKLMDYYLWLWKKVGNEVDTAEIFKYFYSTIKAINLLELYINSSDTIRKEIIDSIQKNFDGDLFVEDTLNKFEITDDSSMNADKIKKLIY